MRTTEQYDAYMAEVRQLISESPAPGSAKAERLELLTVLIEAYERDQFPIEAPDPIDAIQFRMHEQGLKQSDLVPYFGTRSRVSEVLGRKRPLTVQMIRALSAGLGISAETLVGTGVADGTRTPSTSVDWSKFPVKEMISRGWIARAAASATTSAEDLVQGFLQHTGLTAPGGAAFKRSLHGDAYSPTTKYALLVWLARIIQRARDKEAEISEFDPTVLGPDFVRELAQLSWFEGGPLLAIEFLQKHGIAVVVEPHLRGTMLDGAALSDEGGRPIIGLTLRFDRLDHFWFTLLHEVAHVWKHVSSGETFMDDLESASEDKREVEANRIAKEAAIPRAIWKRSEAYLNPTTENIGKLSRELKIHPAIIAGRLRRDLGNYQMLNDLVGHDQVRKLFVDSQ